MRNLTIFCVLMSSWFLAAGELRPAPLADTVWEGELKLEVSGTLRNHYLANKMKGADPTGFIREKSNMDVSFMLRVPFLVNNVGEISLVSERSFKATQVSNLEENNRFTEDVTFEGGIQGTQEVLQKISRLMKIEYTTPRETYRLPNGFLLILPGGRIDKKGHLTFEGNMLYEFQGEGSYTMTTERTPPSEEFAVLKETANVSRTFSLPIKFSFLIDFNKKPVDVSIPIRVEVENPFKKKEKGGKDIYTGKLKAVCKVTMNPLFGKFAKE